MTQSSPFVQVKQRKLTKRSQGTDNEKASSGRDGSLTQLIAYTISVSHLGKKTTQMNKAQEDMLFAYLTFISTLAD